MVGMGPPMSYETGFAQYRMGSGLPEDPLRKEIYKVMEEDDGMVNHIDPYQLKSHF